MLAPEHPDMDRIPVASLLVDADGSIVGANALCEELFGYDHGELTSVELAGLFPTDDGEGCRQLIAAAFGDDAVSPPEPAREVEALTRDSREIVVEFAVASTTDRSRAFVAFHDVTDTARMIAQLRETDQRLRLGALHTNDLVQFLSIAEDSLGWYGDLDAVLGYRAGEFPTTLSGWLELIHPDDIDRIQREYDRTIADGEESWEVRYRLRAGDGTYRHMLDRGTFINFVDGAPNGGVGGIIDETEQVLARQELQEALAHVEELKDRLQAESWYLQSEIASTHGFEEIIGDSDSLKAVLGQVESVAQTDATVLVFGETGTGKELLARAIHSHSRRKDRPLIKVDCSTLPSSLIESELFGHEKGAYTGAHESQAGRFELADQGTIFLDEIGELPLDLQGKLLHVIEDGELRRVGGKADQHVDVRVIAATNRDLQSEVREGRFRADLYYRISVFPIEAPPLRERREDIAPLVSFFVSKYATAFAKPVCKVSQATMDALEAYDWPGNVRELRNVIERSVILCAGDTLTVDAALLGARQPGPATDGALKDHLQAIERARIMRALEEARWKIKGEGNAASRLGVTPSGLHSRMKRLGITRPD